jgi:hypothetical protein
MRYYLIDELDQGKIKKIKDAMDAHGLRGAIEDIYYIPVPDNLLTEEQKDHCNECGPYILAAETGEDWLKMELLVRAQNKIRCSCITYAQPAVREELMTFIDDFIKELDIPV